MSQRISPNLVYDLIYRFGDIYNCYENLKKEKCNLELLLNVKESLSEDVEILEYMKRKDIKIIYCNDKCFPKNIKESRYKIPYIFYKGNYNLLNRKILGLNYNNKLLTLTRNNLKSILNSLDINIVMAINSISESDIFVSSIIDRNCIYITTSIEKFEETFNDLYISLLLNENDKNNAYFLTNMLISCVSDSIYIPESKVYTRAMISANISIDLERKIYVTGGFGKSFSGCNYLLKNNYAIAIGNSNDIEMFEEDIDG